MSHLDELPTDGPPAAPDTDPPPSYEEGPSYSDLDIGAEFDAVELAWDDIKTAVDEDEARSNLDGGTLIAWLFSAVSSGSYEGAESDPPTVSVLRAARETVEGWAHVHGESTHFASISYADLGLLARRIDAAIVLVKAQVSILLRRAEKAEKRGGAS
jgi:hypothetical protein